MIYLVLLFSGIVLSFVKAGESKGEYDPAATVFATVIELWILFAGGFFS